MPSIRVLAPETARLIAAGEVIDRPASALRELIDNAIDSGASEIAVKIEEGGSGLIRVVDDGSGMDEVDLGLSILPHATSKIESADDLLRTRSLGFRGEALASIAAVSRLEIVTKDEASVSAHRLVSEPSSKARIEACAGRRGTSVSVSALFKDFPARRLFLKRPQAEASLCRQAFEDKALAHPGLGFRFESGSASPCFLRPASFLERVCELHSEAPRELLHSIGFSGKGFEGELVIAGPAFSRPDRRLMQSFVNRRRVQEWPLIGSLDYAFSGYLPGGLHPFAFLFLEIDPALADFNIHPAKKEVRFKDPEAPRRAMIAAVQSFLGELARRDPAQALPDPSLELELRLEPLGGGHLNGGWTAYSKPDYRGGASRDWSGFEEVRERVRAGQAQAGQAQTGAEPSSPGAAQERSFRYLGQALGPFLLFEREGALWFLDQHAAHERMLFDELLGRPAVSQPLLVPESFEAENDEEDRLLEEALPRLASAGFVLERRLESDFEGEQGRNRERGSWLVGAAPPELARGAADAAREIARDAGDARRAAVAMAACRAAIKDGDSLDKAAAEELIERALGLPEPRCPHGRPIWTRITREQLYRLVRREL